MIKKIKNKNNLKGIFYQMKNENRVGGAREEGEGWRNENSETCAGKVD